MAETVRTPALGDGKNKQGEAAPRPLAGVRVLAVEQMAALPYATQLLARRRPVRINFQRRAIKVRGL